MHPSGQIDVKECEGQYRFKSGLNFCACTPDDCQKHETQSSVREWFCCLIRPIRKKFPQMTL